MNVFIASIVAALPNVFLAVLGKVVTESFMQSVLEKVLVSGLRKAASLSSNTIDDEIVADIEARLKARPGG